MFYSNFACEIIPMWPRIENVNLLALTHQVHLKLSSGVRRNTQMDPNGTQMDPNGTQMDPNGNQMDPNGT